MDALLSLGGNMGDRRATMAEAVARLGALPGTSVTAVSSCYRTEPDGPVAQDWFVNLAVALRTERDVAALAGACRSIEADLGRDRSAEVPWGPRPIDIDVIATGSGANMEPAGGKLDRRAFVIVPLAEIAPDVAIGGTRIVETAAGIEPTGVERLDWAIPLPAKSAGF